MSPNNFNSSMYSMCIRGVLSSLSYSSQGCSIFLSSVLILENLIFNVRLSRIVEQSDSVESSCDVVGEASDQIHSDIRQPSAKHDGIAQTSTRRPRTGVLC